MIEKSWNFPTVDLPQKHVAKFSLFLEPEDPQDQEVPEENGKKPKKQSSSDLSPSPSVSSSSVSLNELPKNIIEKSNSTESDSNEDKSIHQMPMPLVEENKEPGVRNHSVEISCFFYHSYFTWNQNWSF